MGKAGRRECPFLAALLRHDEMSDLSKAEDICSD